MRIITIKAFSILSSKDFKNKISRSDIDLCNAVNGRTELDRVCRVSKKGESKRRLKYSKLIKMPADDIKALVKKHKCVAVTVYYDVGGYLHKI